MTERVRIGLVMETSAGELTLESVMLVLRRLALERSSGILEVRPEGSQEPERFYFLAGELYLPPRHPLAILLARDGYGNGTEASGQQRRIPDGWFEEAVENLQSMNRGEYQFIEDPTGISTDMVGPLPTFSIVMAGAVKGLDEFGLLRLLGGENARLATAPVSLAPSPSLVELDPSEAFFLSRMERPIAVKDLLQQSELGAFQALRHLGRLFSAGFICNAEDLPRSRQGSLLEAGLLEKFSQRIEASLERRPVGLEPEEHRRRIASLLGRLGAMTYYELLGIGTSATSEEIHDAYSNLARVVHPSQARALGLAGKEGGMLLLFEKATEAYLTLNDRDRSRRYLQEIGSPGDIHGGHQTAEVRRGEVENLAEENYRRAQAMVAREDFHFAVELLQQAVRVDPKAEYYVLLARCQARNPKWIQKAIASYGRALQLAGQELEIRVELGRLLEASGDYGRARREYQEVVRRQPNHPEASSGLERLKSGKPAPESSETGWLDKLRSKLAGGK